MSASTWVRTLWHNKRGVTTWLAGACRATSDMCKKMFHGSVSQELRLCRKYSCRWVQARGIFGRRCKTSGTVAKYHSGGPSRTVNLYQWYTNISQFLSRESSRIPNLPQCHCQCQCSSPSPIPPGPGARAAATCGPFKLTSSAAVAARPAAPAAPRLSLSLPVTVRLPLLRVRVTASGRPRLSLHWPGHDHDHDHDHPSHRSAGASEAQAPSLASLPPRLNRDPPATTPLI
eukprot:3940340-Rhodomonas_salina.1